MEGTEAKVGAGFQELMRVLKVVEGVALGEKHEVMTEPTAPAAPVNAGSVINGDVKVVTGDEQVGPYMTDLLSLLD
jgi:hypothetical protein